MCSGRSLRERQQFNGKLVEAMWFNLEKPHKQGELKQEELRKQATISHDFIKILEAIFGRFLRVSRTSAKLEIFFTLHVSHVENFFRFTIYFY